MAAQLPWLAVCLLHQRNGFLQESHPARSPLLSHHGVNSRAAALLHPASASPRTSRQRQHRRSLARESTTHTFDTAYWQIACQEWFVKRTINESMSLGSCSCCSRSLPLELAPCPGAQADVTAATSVGMSLMHCMPFTPPPIELCRRGAEQPLQQRSGAHGDKHRPSLSAQHAGCSSGSSCCSGHCLWHPHHGARGSLCRCWWTGSQRAGDSAEVFMVAGASALAAQAGDCIGLLCPHVAAQAHR